MRALLPIIVFALLAAGCGYKGPLYLPKTKTEAKTEPKTQAQKPAPKPAPAQEDSKPEGS